MTKLAVVLMLAAGVAACGKKEEKAAEPAKTGGAPAPAAAAGGDCLVGTWEREDAGKTKKLIFNADKTGADDLGDGTKSNFKWAVKNDKSVHLTYLAEGDSVGGEFDIPYDCAGGTVYTMYRKK